MKRITLGLLASLLLTSLAIGQQSLEPRVDHIEEELVAKLPGYVPFEVVPPEPENPTTQPGDLYDPVEYPSKPGAVATSGQNLSDLVAASTLEDGTYSASGDIKFNCVARNPGKAILVLKANQTPQLPDTFAGINVTGGGKPDSDDLKTAGTKAGSLVHSCKFLKSEGFGLLIIRGGVRVTQSEIAFNGSGGLGGTTSSTAESLVDNCEIHHNNTKYKRTNSNKVTRMKVTFRDDWFHHNCGGDGWGDNYVQYLAFLRCKFEENTPDKSNDPWKANNVRGEIMKKLLVKNCLFINNIWAPICINEVSEGTVIDGNIVDGTSGKAIELRNMKRSGSAAGYSLKNVVIKNNIFKRNDLNIVPSGAQGERVDMSDCNIVVEDNNKWPDGKIKEHVKLKP